MAYLGLVVAARVSAEPRVVGATYLALERMTWFAIIPLAAVSLVTGLLQSIVTHWGLFRHYWVLFKLVLTLLATVVLLLNTRTVVALAADAAETTDPGTRGLDGQLLHAGGGLLVLLAATTLAVYKPRGTTPFTRRKTP